MNLDKPLRRVTIFGLLLIFALMVNVNYIQGVEAERLQKDPLNNRQYLEQFNRDRGAIIAGNQTLAFSQDTGRKDQRYQRTYRGGEIFSPVTGYFAVSGGKTGVELAEDGLLDGTDKRLTVRRWFDSFVGKPPKGATVETTIDPRAQQIAYNALAGSTARRAAAVVMDAKTGAIRIMASYPSFDPNQVAVHNGDKANAAFKRLQKADFQPMLNKAINETFPPGSSFKSIVASAALENGMDTSTPVPAPPSFLLPGTHTTLPNSHNDGGNCGAEKAPLINTFAESCNTTFAILGSQRDKLGPDKVIAQARKFGFYQRIPVEPGVSAAPSAFPQTKDGARTALASIGQGDARATPLQMAMVAAAIVNDGKLMKPYLVDKVKAPDQSVLLEARQAVFAEPISSGTASQMREMMLKVVQDGTAKNLNGQQIAGKTGTAETGRGFNERWFVGFGPPDNPRYAFAVVTEGQGAAATAAGPLAAQMLQAVQSR